LLKHNQLQRQEVLEGIEGDHCQKTFNKRFLFRWGRHTEQSLLALGFCPYFIRAETRPRCISLNDSRQSENWCKISIWWACCGQIPQTTFVRRRKETLAQLIKPKVLGSTKWASWKMAQDGNVSTGSRVCR